MSSINVPTADTVERMSPAELDACILALDVSERRQQAALALLATRAEQAGTFLADGHRTSKAWTRGACNWSGQQAARTVRLGRAFELLPYFATCALAGEIGIAQMHALALVATNPRVREHLADSEQLHYGRRQRFFTGELRRAVLLSAVRCTWPGCDIPANKCAADHTQPHSEGGHTCTENGGPLCDHHNWLKNLGFTIVRNPNGTWTLHRPDGIIVGWRNNTPIAGN